MKSPRRKKVHSLDRGLTPEMVVYSFNRWVWTRTTKAPNDVKCVVATVIASMSLIGRFDSEENILEFGIES